ncbi:hypothetical protein WKW79_29905 [Variovorax robiniae]|uniref:Uncharacterized protein n=1 Tax=Variovorax robiniae TaxID=1836199 RepID=A0ABU8XG50_9BURK
MKNLNAVLVCAGMAAFASSLAVGFAWLFYLSYNASPAVCSVGADEPPSVAEFAALSVLLLAALGLSTIGLRVFGRSSARDALLGGVTQ